MAKKIKNIDTIAHTWGGVFIEPNSIYECLSSTEENIFANDNNFISALSNNIAEAYLDNLKISIITDFIRIFSGNDAKQSQPFASKIVNGKKLYRRKHGIRQNCPANSNTTMTFVVPYNFCKIDEVEIINCSGNDNVDLKILDSTAGVYSGVANYLLNQFGFDVCLSDLYYSDSSNYDAELYIGMQIQVTYKNNDATNKNIGLNFVLHEMK